MIDPEYLKTLPAWAGELAAKYATHTVNQFILHGNVRDLVPLRRQARTEFHNLKTFLSESLFAGRDFVLHYDRASGLAYANNETANDFAAFLKAYQTVQNTPGQPLILQVPKEPYKLFPIIDRYIRTRLAERKSLALIVEYAELIAPQSDAGGLAEGDRATLIYLRNWADDPSFLQADVTVCLITEQLSRLNQDLVRNPYSVPVEIELPDAAERREFIAEQTAERNWDELSAIGHEAMAELTGGLSRVHVQQVLADAIRHRVRLDLGALMQRKKELIEAECYGLLEFIEPKFNLDLVAGADAVVTELRGMAKMIKGGRLDVIPMGYLICGPVGTGKTFLVTCFAGEIGIPCVKLLNIRSQWQGVTEANLQKLLGIFRAMGPLGVILDEADTWIGDRDASGDSGTSSRIFGTIASFMADTTLRGRVIWFLMTARPDLLPVDIKRQGRAEEHVPLFHPLSAADRQALYAVIVRKNKIKTDVQSVEEPYQAAGSPRLSGADLEAVCIRAKRHAAIRGSQTVDAADFAQAFAQFIPPVYGEEIEYQALAAVMECTNRDLLPEPYRSMPRDQVALRLRQLRPLVH
ncbi:MAG: ATP-binding protein [Myxococcales bacterium]|nr:ATP-binding protein [Myxococcales bacterium]